MSAPCTPLIVTEDPGVDITVTPDVAVDMETTGNNQGMALTGGSVTCCAEAVLEVGVLYNNQWFYDGSVTYGATVA
jgi:hypothetical protein